jgi:glycine/D-amino acid oxidase-like deaminating enzyme/nitrite reductase/ring-hydroxylating ferredoxin subunit
MERVSPIAAAENESIWGATVELPKSRRLTTGVNCDVCIVGSGISGLTTAYLLSKSGKRVVLLDDGPLASGMTHVTTAHLSNVIDDRFVNMLRWHGEEKTRLAVQSHAAAIDFIEQTSSELHIDCDFQRLDGYLFDAGAEGAVDLDDEFAAAQQAGVGVRWSARAPLDKYDTGRCLRFPNQARFHPFKYLDGLVKAFKRLGGKVFTNSHVDSITGGEAAEAKVGNHVVSAASVVVATNSPINDRVAIHTKQAPYMTYVAGARVPRGSVDDALFWDTLEAYHYVRLQPLDVASDLLIIGGEDHKSGQADDADERHQRLLDWARERFPVGEIEFTWGGQWMESIDGLAFIGRNPLDDNNVYVVTGDSGMGMTHGTIAGMLLTDMILGRQNPWEHLYDPSRKTLAAAGPYVKENVNVAGQYLDWLTPGEVKSVDEIAPGTGAIVRRGLTKIAACRDDDGKLTELSAVCPHLGCVVHWNNAERSWDCPCHGSRFHADGKVVNGPANVNLSPVDPSTDE